MGQLHGSRIALKGRQVRPIAFLIITFIAGASAESALGQDPSPTVARQIEITATYENIGIRWKIDNDDNLNGRASVRYRKRGAGNEWLEGLPLVRSHPGLQGEGGERGDNRWAGSIFWLEPATEYELELRIEDPDGGSVTRQVEARTRYWRTNEAVDAGGHGGGKAPRYVVPGNGGGSGTEDDPFRGLQAAADAAQADDLFEVASGTYSPFQLLASGTADGEPITVRGPEDGSAIIDGAGTDRGIITLGRNDQTIEHVMLEHLTLRDGHWGIDAQHSRDIQVRFLTVKDVDDGYVNRRGDGREGNQTICDSIFVGRVPWPGSGIPSERGIDLKGDGNVVCNNRVSRFGDGVSVQPSTGRAWGNDIYSNDIFQIVDDPIEIDYNDANARVWGNRVTSGRMGVSLAPIYGGPVYVFRNVFFSLESSAYKMNRAPAGLFIAHNTSLKRGNATSSPAGWQNTFLRNNYLFGTRYLFEEYGTVKGSVDDWDFDAFAREPACGDGTPPCFKWDNTRYDTLADLRAGVGIEASGIGAQRSDLIDAPLPEAYTTAIAPDDYDLRLREGVPEVDAGAVLPNINAPWVRDGRPDIGAYELGQGRPIYGPGPLVASVYYLGWWLEGPATPTPGVVPSPGPSSSPIASPTAPPTATQPPEATPSTAPSLEPEPTTTATALPSDQPRTLLLPWLTRGAR